MCLKPRLYGMVAMFIVQEEGCALMLAILRGLNIF